MLAIQGLKDRLRRDLGGVSTGTLSDDQATDCIMSAVREYSKYKPIEVLDYITTIANTSGYSLSTKTLIIGVKKVYYSSYTVFSVDPLQTPDYSFFGNLEGLSIYDNPSLWIQYTQRLESFLRIFDGDFQYDKSSKLLTLIPVPTQAQKIYYIWRKAHRVETIPDDDEDKLILWGLAEANQRIASKRGNEIRSVSGYGESVSFGSTPESLMKEVSQYRDRFKNAMSGGSTIIVG